MFFVVRSSRRLLVAAVCSPQVSAGHYTVLYGQRSVYGITGRRHSDIGRPPTAAADNTSSSSSAADNTSSSSSLLMQVQVDSNRLDHQQQKTAIDEEREMFLLKRRMSEAYSKGHYRNALSFAQQLEEKASTLLGVKNAVYASCLNNTALMHKMLGQRESSMSKYVAALHVYEDVGGKLHTSYASTLANLGVLYKDLARDASGLERQQLLERSSEALGDALSIRTSLLGPAHKDTLYSMLHSASLRRLRADLDGALRMLSEALVIAVERFGCEDLICAAIHNDLGLVHKSRSQFDAAQESYQKAVHTRSKVLGDSHPDTIVSIHNLAELLSARGEQDAAASYQRRLVSIFEASGYRDSSSSAGDDAVTVTSSVSEVGTDAAAQADSRQALSVDSRQALSVDSQQALSVDSQQALSVDSQQALSVNRSDSGPSEEARRTLSVTSPFSSGMHKPSARKKKRS